MSHDVYFVSFILLLCILADITIVRYFFNKIKKNKVIFMAVKKRLDNLNKRLKTLKSNSKSNGIPAIIIAAGNYCVSQLLKKWQMGVGGNNKTLQSPKGNKKYLDRKQEKTGRGRIDMQGISAKDNMNKQLDVKLKSKIQGAVAFKTPSAREKAAANYDLRPQFFTLSKRLKNECLKKAFEFYMKIVGKGK